MIAATCPHCGRRTDRGQHVPERCVLRPGGPAEEQNAEWLRRQREVGWLAPIPEIEPHVYEEPDDDDPQQGVCVACQIPPEDPIHVSHLRVVR